FVSVIVATYNRGDVLFDTLAMVMANTYPRFELIVVDQTTAPSGAYRRRLADLRAQFDFVYLTLPAPSLTFARNVGVQQAKGDLIIFIDDDVQLEPDFVEAHVRAFADPAVAGVAGRVLDQKYDTAPPDGPVGKLLPDGSPSGNLH